MKLNIYFTLLILFFIFFSSCERKIETEGWSPEIITPLANINLTLGDLIPEEGSVVYDESNFISLAYREDNIFSLHLTQFLIFLFKKDLMKIILLKILKSMILMKRHYIL